MKKFTIILLATLLAVTLIACETEDYTPVVYGEVTLAAYEQEAPASTSGLIEAHVMRVIDGDTLELSNGERVRLIGVDAPEIGEPGAEEATRFVREKVEGQSVWLEADGTDRDRFDRLRRYVWLQIPTDTQNEEQIRTYQLNAMLLENGLADVLILGDVANETLFRQLATPASQPQPTIDTAPVAATAEPDQSNFIGNRNSEVFHSATCNSLPAPHNRIYFETREAAVNAGYTACQRCRP